MFSQAVSHASLPGALLLHLPSQKRSAARLFENLNCEMAILKFRRTAGLEMEVVWWHLEKERFSRVGLWGWAIISQIDVAMLGCDNAVEYLFTVKEKERSFNARLPVARNLGIRQRATTRTCSPFLRRAGKNDPCLFILARCLLTMMTR